MAPEPKIPPSIARIVGLRAEKKRAAESVARSIGRALAVKAIEKRLERQRGALMEKNVGELVMMALPGLRGLTRGGSRGANLAALLDIHIPKGANYVQIGEIVAKAGYTKTDLVNMIVARDRNFHMRKLAP